MWADKEKRRERKRGKERGEKSGLLFLLSARLMVLLLLRKKVRMIVASAVLDSVSLLRWRRILLHSFVDERKGLVRLG